MLPTLGCSVWSCVVVVVVVVCSLLFFSYLLFLFLLLLRLLDGQQMWSWCVACAASWLMEQCVHSWFLDEALFCTLLLQTSASHYHQLLACACFIGPFTYGVLTSCYSKVTYSDHNVAHTNDANDANNAKMWRLSVVWVPYSTFPWLVVVFFSSHWLSCHFRFGMSCLGTWLVVWTVLAPVGLPFHFLVLALPFTHCCLFGCGLCLQFRFVLCKVCSFGWPGESIVTRGGILVAFLFA